MFGTQGPAIRTIGHSNRTADAFLSLLRENWIEVLVDVRHYPTSSHVPWARGEDLAERLHSEGVAYEHAIALGGFRKARPDSPNTGWRQAGFRGYADHMGTEEFQAAVDHVLHLAARRRTALMCAEAVPWRCHRGLLSDALVVRGARVIHILSEGTTQEHTLTSFAKVHGGHVTYPAPRGKAYMRRRA